MSTQDLYAIIGSNVVAIAVIGGLIGTFFWRTTARLDRRIDNDRAAADADRRAFQDAMRDFRTEMQRLAERQSHLEGARTAASD